MTSAQQFQVQLSFKEDGLQSLTTFYLLFMVKIELTNTLHLLQALPLV